MKYRSMKGLLQIFCNEQNIITCLVNYSEKAGRRIKGFCETILIKRASFVHNYLNWKEAHYNSTFILIFHNASGQKPIIIVFLIISIESNAMEIGQDSCTFFNLLFPQSEIGNRFCKNLNQ